MRKFIFDTYAFDPATGEAVFRYHFDEGLKFAERVRFNVGGDYDGEALDRALFLAFVLIGISYYKTFPTPEVQFLHYGIDDWQAAFLNNVYQEGLSQFAFENNLTRDDLAAFAPHGEVRGAVAYDGEGILQLQSGGKDSLLMATLLAEHNKTATPLYISSSSVYPAVIDQLGEPIILTRTLDHEALADARQRGGRNGHVPVTYIVLALSLAQAILSGKNTVIASIGHEGEEPHEWIGDLPVNHQWSKTWQAEQLFSEYVKRYISPAIMVGSPLRQYSELTVAELFAEKAWPKFGHSFSSCNVANYGQGVNNKELTWCGQCPKCANSYLLFAPFVAPAELQSLFGGKELFTDPLLEDTFKGLLAIDDAMKPFECVGEIAELRFAYHAALTRGFAPLPFFVPKSDFNKDVRYDTQEWATRLVA